MEPRKADFLAFCVTSYGDRQWYALVQGKMYGGFDTKAELQDELVKDGHIEPQNEG